MSKNNDDDLITLENYFINFREAVQMVAVQTIVIVTQTIQALKREVVGAVMMAQIRKAKNSRQRRRNK